jgi:hypothetical protein
MHLPGFIADKSLNQPVKACYCADSRNGRIPDNVQPAALQNPYCIDTLDGRRCCTYTYPDGHHTTSCHPIGGGITLPWWPILHPV